MAKVTINQGVLIGRTTVTENDFEYIEFLQIPYAKAPVGDLRFKSPQVPEPWEDERDATTFDMKKVSMQYDFLKNEVRGSEDCLYLNVYTPQLPTTESEPLPVMVYVHGGGFVCGNGTFKDECGPELLLEHNVVIVSINYRLSIFGFLSLDIPEAAGNMGLKDQVMALNWIQNNISNFGGDKDNVTLFGISAGAASIEYILLSPLSTGLFHKAILQSGSTLNHWAINYDIKDLSIKVAQELGYQGSSNDVREIYEYLIGQPTETLGEIVIKASKIFTAKGTYFGFVPSIEKDFGNGEAFLTEYPYNLLKEGRFNKVPIIRGFCDSEGLLLAGLKPLEFQELIQNKNFLEFWKYPLSANDIEEYTEKFQQVYLNDDNETGDEERFAVDFFGDFDFVSGIWESSKLMIENGVPLYKYIFAYVGNLNMLKAALNMKKEGACHGDDTNYIIGNVQLIPNETDILIRNRMTKMWTDFAKTGNPTMEVSDIIPLLWPAFDNDEQSFLVIDKNLDVKSKYYPERMAVYEEIYEKYNK